MNRFIGSPSVTTLSSSALGGTLIEILFWDEIRRPKNWRFSKSLARRFKGGLRYARVFVAEIEYKDVRAFVRRALE